MPIRHSVLALYGAVSDALFLLNAPNGPDTQAAKLARRRARDITGLTGTTGEIGWYGELFRYFEAHPTDRAGEYERIVPPTIEEAVAEFVEIAEQGITTDEDGLQPSWASRAIEAAYALDSLYVALGIVPPQETPVLARVFAATPTNPGFVDGGVLGLELAEQFAATIQLDEDIETLHDLHAALDVEGSPLHAAIRTTDMNARIRKVKDEYCAVMSTTVDWPDITFDKLKAGINPVNWDDYFNGFFCDMTPQNPNAYGWTPVHEEVSGECGRYRLRTPLKFWSEARGPGLFLNYDLDFGGWLEADKMVLVDNGYLWITKLDPADPNSGVRVRTSKELLISGMSATALAVLAKTMGWASNASDMFRKLEGWPGALQPFVESVRPPSPVPPVDTSTTWPVVLPELPADIRDEMCNDTNDLLKRGLDDANTWFGEYNQRWNDEGIDADDFNDLTNLMSGLLREYTKDVFKTATANFRPKAATNPDP